MDRKLGVSIDQTSKCHCKLAREGIKYSWGCKKKCISPGVSSERRKKDKLRETVRQCLSRAIPTTERIRKFSRRVCEYICVYHALHQVQTSNTSDKVLDTDMDSNVATPVKIEKVIKTFQTHWCTLFDRVLSMLWLWKSMIEEIMVTGKWRSPFCLSCSVAVVNYMHTACRKVWCKIFKYRAYYCKGHEN